MSFYQSPPKEFLWYIVDKNTNQTAMISEGFETQFGAMHFATMYNGQPATFGGFFNSGLSDRYEIVKRSTGYKETRP